MNKNIKKDFSGTDFEVESFSAPDGKEFPIAHSIKQMLHNVQLFGRTAIEVETKPDGSKQIK